MNPAPISRPLAHIRQPFLRSLRTHRNWVAVRDPEPRTLCGATVTDRDVSYTTAGTKKFRASGWPVCAACLARSSASRSRVSA